MIDEVVISFHLSSGRNPLDFTTLATTSILPVDLNTFILKVWFRTLLDRINEISNQLTLSRALVLVDSDGVRHCLLSETYWR